MPGFSIELSRLAIYELLYIISKTTPTSQQWRNTVGGLLTGAGFCSRFSFTGTNAIAKVHTPVGVFIKAVTPEEIAVSITGEMIHVRVLCRESSGVVIHGCPMQ